MAKYRTAQSNVSQVARIYGDFWTQVFQQQELINGLAAAHGELFAQVEADEAGYIKWLDERAGSPGIGQATYRALVATSDIRKVKITNDTGLRIGSAGSVGQSAAFDAWRITLPMAINSCPSIGATPLSTAPLIDTVDYILESPHTILIYVDPFDYGFSVVLAEGAQGLPDRKLELFLVNAIPVEAPKHASKWGMYNTGGAVTSAATNLLVGEATFANIVAAIETALGVTSPTIFEQEDEQGVFTWLTNTRTDGQVVTMMSSGDEIVEIPEKYFEPMFSGNEWRHRPGNPLTNAVKWYARITDSDIKAYRLSINGANSVIVLNEEIDIGPSLDLGLGGYVYEVRDFYAMLNNIETRYGKPLIEVFDVGSYNPIEQLFDRQNRCQPAVIQIAPEALDDLKGNEDILRAVFDNLPAGLGLFVSVTASTAEQVNIAVSENVSAFHVSIAEEALHLNIDESIVTGSVA